MNCKNLSQIKIRAIWNRQQSILIVNAVDLTQCKEGSKPDAILKYSKSIAKEWIDDSSKFYVIKFILDMKNGWIII